MGKQSPFGWIVNCRRTPRQAHAPPPAGHAYTTFELFGWMVVINDVQNVCRVLKGRVANRWEGYAMQSCTRFGHSCATGHPYPSSRTAFRVARNQPSRLAQAKPCYASQRVLHEPGHRGFELIMTRAASPFRPLGTSVDLTTRTITK